MRDIISFIYRLKDRVEDQKEQKRYIKENNIKCKATCNACQYEHYCADFLNVCRACGQYDDKNVCKCYTIDNGEKCPYFKPLKSEGCK